jgi:hypothetical protein
MPPPSMDRIRIRLTIARARRGRVKKGRPPAAAWRQIGRTIFTRRFEVWLRGLDSVEKDLQQGLVLVALVLVLLSYADRLIEDLDVVTLVRGLVDNRFLVLVQNFDLHPDGLDALDEGAGPVIVKRP